MKDFWQITHKSFSISAAGHDKINSEDSKYRNYDPGVYSGPELFVTRPERFVKKPFTCIFSTKHMFCTFYFFIKIEKDYIVGFASFRSNSVPVSVFPQHSPIRRSI